ncbi:MAG: crossover junction endodeoxyribonuclease RuvC [Flavobacteriales bacterium]|nr:crossover junction endodeoxyribonuclease RuvC [Flavobacteriales bacterium]
MFSQQGEAAKSSRNPAPGERIILGIDPGTTVMGIAVIRANGRSLQLVRAEAVHIQPAADPVLKLHEIHRHVAAVIAKHHPQELAIEAQFFGKNVQSMLKLGRAQGVAIAAALQYGLAVAEYAPKRVKQSITGRGNATKEQVAAMLPRILVAGTLPESTDATDALAVAVCHCFAQGTGSMPAPAPARRGKADWGSFVRNNPGRVKE